jgi:hypothetical protein
LVIDVSLLEFASLAARLVWLLAHTVSQEVVRAGFIVSLILAVSPLMSGSAIETPRVEALQLIDVVEIVEQPGGMDARDNFAPFCAVNRKTGSGSDAEPRLVIDAVKVAF